MVKINLLLIAVAPTVAIMVYIYFKDKFEKEPFNILLKSFLLGATVSIVITFVLSSILSHLIPPIDVKNTPQIVIKAFITVALVEEFSKYIIVRYYAQRSKEFNEPFDGIVYAVMVSMGFATLENILYVFQYGVETGIIRAITAVPAHAIFAILMGYFIGKAKFSENKKKLNLTGLIIAILFHGAYDFFLFIDFIPGISIGAFLALCLGILLANKAIKKHQDSSQFK